MVRVADRSDVATGVWTITLDRPDRRNAVDHATLVALLDAQRAVAAARAVVLTGAPPAFCAGADLAGVEQGVFARDLDRVLRGFVGLAAPVIAAIDGPALGAGAQLVSVCDLRVASADSVIGVPAARLGLVIDPWTIARLRSEFGSAITRSMLMAAETYSGQRLFDAGVVHRLGGLDDAVSWAREIASLAPLSIGAHKFALESDGSPDANAEYDTLRAAAWSSADASEGRTAFLEKRQPVFRGR